MDFQGSNRKNFCLLLTFAFAAFAVFSVRAQSTFQNLNFESANVSGDTPATYIPASDAFPGWTAIATPDSMQPVTLSQVWYDNQALSSAMIAINDKNLLGGIGGSFAPLDGNFSAYLAGGEGYAVGLSQTGLVPLFAKSLRVDIQTLGLNLQVTVGGAAISLVPLQTTSAYTVYGGNVSAFAGQSEQLSFTEPGMGGIGAATATIDDIQFSPIAILEPGTWTLLLFGAGVLGVARYGISRFKS